MSDRTIAPSEIGRVLLREEKRVKDCAWRGARAASLRAKGHLVDATDERGKVHHGHFKAGWDTEQTADGFSVTNDAPHAGIVEMGARPHPVSAEGREAIREWVRQKIFGISQVEADENDVVDAITYGIVEKLRKYGQEPTYIVRDALPEMTRYLREETERYLRGKRGGK